MKTYMIPCFMLVRAADEAHAYDKVYQVQRGERRIFIYQDETLQAKEVDDDAEYHTILDVYSKEE